MSRYLVNGYRQFFRNNGSTELLFILSSDSCINIVDTNVKELGGQIKKLGMLIIQDYLWGRVGKNRALGISMTI